jgi:hypothetical protein
MAAEMADPRVGQKHPIDRLPDGRIVDGRSRELACRVAGVNPLYITVRLAEYEITAFITAKNLTRRHLEAGQRALIAAELANLANGSNQHKPVTGTATGEGVGAPTPSFPTVSQSQAAELLDVSRESVTNRRRASSVSDPGSNTLTATSRLRASLWAARIAPIATRAISPRTW